MTLYDDALGALKKTLDDHETLDAQLAADNATEHARLTGLLGEAQSDLAAANATALNLDERLTTALIRIQELESEQEEPDPPPTRTVFSAYAGPATKGAAGQTSGTRARVAAAFGVPVLPVDRVYSSTDFGKAAACPSPLVAVSYGQVAALAGGSTTVKAQLRAEIESLGHRTGQRYDVSCDHEVDSKIRSGKYTGAQVEDAHAAFAELLQSVGAPNVRHALCVTGFGLTLKVSDPSHPDNYYADVYDVIAGDPYWPAQPSAAAAFDPFYNWAKAKGKPVVVWETGYQIGGNPQSPTEQQLATKVAAAVDYWDGKGEYVLWFEAVHEVSNLLEGHPQALAIYAAAVRGS